MLGIRRHCEVPFLDIKHWVHSWTPPFELQAVVLYFQDRHLLNAQFVVLRAYTLSVSYREGGRLSAGILIDAKCPYRFLFLVCIR